MFKRLIDDDSTDILPAKDIRRVAFCTGKLYFELANARKAAGIKDVALVRLEQVCHTMPLRPVIAPLCNTPSPPPLPPHIAFHGIIGCCLMSM
jgi:2-oxoglutarate dehydrogenase E1 component